MGSVKAAHYFFTERDVVVSNLFSSKKNIVIIILAAAVVFEFLFIYKLRQDVDENVRKIDTLKHITTAINNDVNSLKKDVLPLRFSHDKEKLDKEYNAAPNYDYEKHDMQKDIKDLQDELSELKNNAIKR